MAAPGKSIAPVRSRHVEERPPSMTALQRFAVAVALMVIAAAPGDASKVAAQPDTRVRPAARIPLSFEANLGQSDEGVKFLARMPAYTLFLTSSETVLALTSPALRAGRIATACPRRAAPAAWSQRQSGVRGSRSAARSQPYFIGRDRQRWRTGVPHYARVGVHDVYPGIDQVFYADGRRARGPDFVVGAGADPSPRPYCVRRCGRAADR